jgi:prepilin-type N-terminal cleavage/methylation domain-containing protein
LPSGATLIELVVALVVLGVFMGFTFSLMDYNQRALSGLVTILETRSALWQGNDALSTELRVASAPGGDMLAISDSAIAYRARVAFGVVCALPSATTLEFPPDSVASGAQYASDLAAVQAGDLAFIYSEGPTSSSADDSWIQGVVSSRSNRAAPCPGSPLLDSIADAGRSGSLVTLSSSALPLAGLPTPSIAYFARPSRFAFYRAGTGEWFLGWTEWNLASATWNVIQPVAGPYAPYAATGASGFRFSFRDSLWNAIAPQAFPVGIAHVGITSRTLTRAPVHVPGLPRARHADSLRIGAALRNRQ